MTPLTLLAGRTLVWLAPTPSPVPEYEGDPNLVTPGAIGFAITFLVAAATVLLLLDMTRRVRRVRYREEVRERLADEFPAAQPVDAPRHPEPAAGPQSPPPKKPRKG